MVITRPPYRLLDLPAMSFDNPIEWVDTSLSNTIQDWLENAEWQECDLRDLPLEAKHAVRIALTRVLALLDTVQITGTLSASAAGQSGVA